MHLTDEQWRLIQPLIAPHLPAFPARGRPPIDERLVLDGILWKLANHAPWYDLPPSYPSHQTCYRRYRRWLRLGVLPAIFNALYTHLHQCTGLDLFQALQSGAARFHLQQGKLLCTFDPPSPPGWQSATAGLLISQLVVRLKLLQNQI